MTQEKPPRLTSYPSDLTDDQWALVEPHIPPERWGGRTREVDIREVVNGILYLSLTGCQWQYTPKDLPNWNTVRHHFDRFRRDGTWEHVHDLRPGRVLGRGGQGADAVGGRAG